MKLSLEEIPMPNQKLSSMNVHLYRYRTATVHDVFLRLPRKLLGELEDALVERAGAHSRDNHTAYKMEDMITGDITYISFSDDLVQIGRSIEERGW